MLFTINFGAAQTGVGYRFSTGSAWVGDRVTNGISQIGAAGNYSVNVEPPATAKVIYWDCESPYATGNENFDLRLKVDAILEDTAALEDRLTAARASLIENLDAAITSRLADGDYTAPDNNQTATLEARLTAERAALLDNLDAAITAIWNQPNKIAGRTPAEAFLYLFAHSLAKSSGWPGGPVVTRNPADTADLITATFDADRNRIAVTLHAP
jgi:hypothetical protein